MPKKRPGKLPDQTTQVQKEFYKRLLFMLIGIVPLFFLWEERGPARFIGGAGVLLSLYNFLMIVAMSEPIVNSFFKPKYIVETTTKPFDKFLYHFAPIFFFGSLVFAVFEMQNTDNTIHGLSLFWRSGFLGIIIATIFTIIIKNKSPSVYFESKRRYVVHFGLYMGFFLFTPALASFINHTFADNNLSCENFEVVRKSTGGSKHNSNWLFLRIKDDTIERFDVPGELFDKVSEGGEVQLCLKQGAIGYRVVTEFRIVFSRGPRP